MKKPRSKRKKKKPKPGARGRRTRVKLHKGPFQIELPLQMPLFPPTYDGAKNPGTSM